LTVPIKLEISDELFLAGHAWIIGGQDTVIQKGGGDTCACIDDRNCLGTTD
jgi:hypothetical protein